MEEEPTCTSSMRHDLQSKDKSEAEEDEPYKCCCFWSPKWARTFTSPVLFLFCVCMVTFSDAVFVGTLTGIATSVEIRFRLTASNLGILLSAFSAGNMLALPFVSYFGGRPHANRPRWIATGAVVIGVGVVLFALPQFLFGKYDAGFLLSNGEVESFECAADSVDDQCSNFEEVGAQNDAAYWIMFTGSTVSGMGFAAVPSLALSYIDDNCKTETTALYAGIIESMYGIGTILGFFISYFCLSLWVDFYRLDPGTTIPSPEHHAWVGAWWLGILICAVFFLVSSMPLFGFPVRLPRRSSKEDKVETSKDSDVKDLRENESRNGRNGFLKTYFRLIRNPVLMFITLGMMCEFATLYGFGTFFAKYLETQFEITASFADLLTGVAMVPPYGIGWILGGFIVKRTKMGFSGMFYFTIGCLLMALVGSILMLFFGCSNPNIAGANFGYPGQSLSEVSLAADCNVNCNCTTASYQPVCDVMNDIIYVSPCFAGCNDVKDGVYHNCSCLGGLSDAAVVAGLCEFDCIMLIPFMLVQFIQIIAVTMAGVPQIMLLLRFVDPLDKTLALGFNRVFTSLGGLVGPLIFAVFIDYSCTVWQSVCGDYGACLVYDIDRYRYYFIGVSIVMGALIVIFTCPAYYFIRKNVPTTNGRTNITFKQVKELDENTNLKCEYYNMQRV